MIYNYMMIRTSNPKTLSIAEIGAVRFWAGVFLGIGFTIMLYLLISTIRDIIPLMILRFRPTFFELVVTDTQRYIHNLFVAGLACVLGQNIALRTWLDKGCYKYKNVYTRRHCTQATHKLGFVFNGTLMFLAGMYIPWFAYLGLLGLPHETYLLSLRFADIPLPKPPPTMLVLHSDHLEYWLLFILFLFFFQYMNVRTIYLCGRLMLVFLFITMTAAVVLANINMVYLVMR